MRKYRKKNRFQGKNHSKGVRWCWWVLGAVIWFGYMMLSFRPEYQPLRDTIVWKISGKLVFSGVILYFAWLSPHHPPRGGQTIMTLMATIFWQTMVIPSNRFLLLCMTVYSFSGIGYLLWLMITKKKNNEPLMFATMYLVIMVMSAMKDYTYVYDNNATRHWQICMILALLTGAAAWYLMYHGYIRLKDDRTSEKVCWCIMALFCGFVLPWMTINNMNYMLDLSEPERFDMVIVDKEIDNSGKDTDYEMTLRFRDEEIELNVSQSVYFRYEIGQTLPVDLYQGFFNDPYYINE